LITGIPKIEVRADAAASGFGILHHVFAAKPTKPDHAMDPEGKIVAINKEIRRLFNCGEFSLVRDDAVPSRANTVGTRIIHPYQTNTLAQSTKRQKIA
jgi:hypothetical protein